MILRSLFLTLSRSDRLRHWMVHFGPARRMARRFIAGETLDEAVAAARQLQAQGILTAFDHLGENVATPQDAERAVCEYQALLQRIAAEGLPATISVKLTHIGLDFGEEFCCARLRSIAQTAQSLGNTVEVDIEGSAYTQATLAVFHCLLDDYQNLRLALQAYLFRTEADLARLKPLRPKIRLVKGAYLEPADVAFPSKSDVDANFVKLMRILFADGFTPAVGSHDERMIDAARALAKEFSRSSDSWEVQMLHGIRRDLQEQLVRDGYRMRVYVTFGTEWVPYFMRRLAERPANLGFVLKSLLKGR